MCSVRHKSWDLNLFSRHMSAPSIDQAEGRVISPHVVRRALENTATPVHNVPEEALTIGRGLLQVDR